LSLYNRHLQVSHPLVARLCRPQYDERSINVPSNLLKLPSPLWRVMRPLSFPHTSNGDWFIKAACVILVEAKPIYNPPPERFLRILSPVCTYVPVIGQKDIRDSESALWPPHSHVCTFTCIRSTISYTIQRDAKSTKARRTSVTSSFSSYLPGCSL